MKKPLITWTQEYAVGHKGLDAEHQLLVDLINKIHSAECDTQKDHQLELLLKNLQMAAVEHFRHENSLMRTVSDLSSSRPIFATMICGDTINEHYVQHAKALAELETIIALLRAEPDVAERKVSANLRDWFIEHAVKCDAHLRTFLSKLR